MTSGDWVEVEIIRFINRAERFMKIGMTEMEAQHLASRLLYRDRPDSGDDRRICLECKQCRKGQCKTPKTGYCTIPTLLQRCDGFVAKVGP